MQKPAVVGYIDQKIRAVEDKLPDEIADGVFETNQGRDADIGFGQMKHGMFATRSEIARDPSAGDGGEKRKRMSQRNVFTKRNEMDFAIDLHLLAIVRDEQCRVVIVTVVEVE